MQRSIGKPIPHASGVSWVIANPSRSTKPSSALSPGSARTPRSPSIPTRSTIWRRTPRWTLQLRLMPKPTVTFGEIMLRLAPPGMERFLQSPQFVATFGGGEANVAVAVANFGLPSRYVTVLPENPIADAAVAELRRFGVDSSRIVRGKGRLGVYYLEAGANQRPSKVVYDRAGSAIAIAKPGDIDWAASFEGSGWFHITGITPAISATAAELSFQAVRKA